jgi:hypothetical protein
MLTMTIPLFARRRIETSAKAQTRAVRRKTMCGWAIGHVIFKTGVGLAKKP